MKPKYYFICPNEQNELMVPYHKQKVDYYVNPCLSQLKDNYVTKKVMKKAFLMRQRIKDSYPKEDKVFIVPYHENKGD